MAADGSVIIEILGDAKEFTKTLGNIAGKAVNGLKTSFVAVTAAVTAASTAVGVLAKQSLEAYGSYEQLVGGVETLFKDSSNVVLNYANNAYKTAGLSANEYMETVTSFSASLLQSLGGDTEKAAQVADKAITDMADNANKMGTSMGSIQYAYQGFAKQNYTMLDNLKLGYGGTKEEMQRLLSDAEKLSGQKFDLSSYADIVEAIHVVQTEMGITGTTAAEASSTIEGSLSAVSASWTNLLTGIADENANLDTLIDNFVQSAATAAENVVPRLIQILSGMGTSIETLAPILAQQIPELISGVLPSLASAGAQLLVGLITGLISALPALASAVPEIVNALSSSISENLPKITESGAELLNMLKTGISKNLPSIISTGISIIGSIASGIMEVLPEILETGIQILAMLADGIIEAIPQMAEQLPQIITAIVEFVLENLPIIAEKGFDIIIALAEGIINAIPDMVEELPKIIEAITDYITTEFPLLLRKGGELLGKLISGMIDAIPEIAERLPDVINAIENALKAGWEQIKNVGSYLLEGLWAGIGDKVEWLKGKVAGIVDTIKERFIGKEGFDEHSPSKWAHGVGEYINEGLAGGLEDSTNTVENSTKKVVNVVSALLDQMNGDLEQQFAEKEISANPEFLDRIPETVDQFPDELKPIGEHAVQGLIEGMNNMSGDAVYAAQQLKNNILKEFEPISAELSSRLKAASDSQSARITENLTISANAPVEARRATDTRRAAENASANAAFGGGTQSHDNSTFVLNIGAKEFYRGTLSDLRAVEDASPRVRDD